jgi:hypothetical protein
VKIDLQKEARRGRAARAELALVNEHIEGRAVDLFERFCSDVNGDETYLIREEAQALKRVQAYLEELVTTGKLAETQLNEGE